MITNKRQVELINTNSIQNWLNSDARYILMDCPSNVLSWIWEDDMTDEEKEQHPEYSVTGGFLKHIEKGVTAYEVSKATGIPNSTFSDWKTGKSKPKIEKLKKIAEYFQIPITELI